MDHDRDHMFPLAVSACLLGEAVRYDGDRKLDPYITTTLGRYFSFVPVCPEVECGMPVPREPMHLAGDPASPRLVTNRTGIDHTGRMRRWSTKKLDELAGEGLCGYIFKSRSPSCGMTGIGVRGSDGKARNPGAGLFARAFMARFPRLPVIDEHRLHDPVLRESFIEAVFVLRRWREFLAGRRTKGDVVAFHTEHKLIFLARSEKIYREMGRLVARAGDLDPGVLQDRYEELLMAAMRLKPTARKHTNVLMHVMGYFKRQLGGDDKAELLEAIHAYRAGRVPLLVPLTLLNHYVRKFGQPYLARQHYLNPHPVELRFRTHV